MSDHPRFDVVIAGAGPAGSVAALVLARGGARVALVDKSAFPRDKACGDLIGPRGVALLADLGIELVGGSRQADILLVGPTGRRTRLPAYAGPGYPGHGLALPRLVLDDRLRLAALAAGAEPIRGRVVGLDRRAEDGVVCGVRLAGGTAVRAEFVLGADGALTRVGADAGLVDPAASLYGFAVRCYLEAADPAGLPVISLLGGRREAVFPGYGWLFPGVDATVNLGIGIAGGADRSVARRAGAALTPYGDRLRATGLLRAGEPGPRTGGWLKFGLVGTVPARGRVLLVGDAAGLVNPLQGEGIAQAMRSGLLAARAILEAPGDPAVPYRAGLSRTFGPFLSAVAPLHRGMVRHPRAVPAVGRLITAPGLGRLLAGSWSILWNDVLDADAPTPVGYAARLALAATRVSAARTATAGRLAADLRG